MFQNVELLHARSGEEGGLWRHSIRCGEQNGTEPCLLWPRNLCKFGQQLHAIFLKLSLVIFQYRPDFGHSSPLAIHPVQCCQHYSARKNTSSREVCNKTLYLLAIRTNVLYNEGAIARGSR